MPITSNGFYNDTGIGQAFGNIASMFAPPSMNDVAMAQNIRANQAAASLNQQKFAEEQAAAAAKNAAIGRLRQQNPDVADALQSGAADPVKMAAQLHQLQLAGTGAPLTGQDAYKYVYGPAGDLVSTDLAKPMGADTVSYRPAGLLGPSASTAYGPIKTGDRTTLFPNGAPPSPGAASADDDDTDTARIKAGLGVGGASASVAAAPTALGGRSAAPGGFDPITAAITGGLLTGSAAPSSAGGTPTLGGGYSQPSAPSAPATVPSAPAAAATPDNGISYGPGGVMQISAPDKPDTMDTAQAAASKNLSPQQQQQYLLNKDQGQTINVNSGNPQKLDDAVTGADADDIHSTVAAGYTAPQSLQQVAYLRQAIKNAGPNLSTGPFAQYALKGKQALGNLLGTELPGTSEAEVINNIGNQLATQGARAISSRPTQFEFAQQLAVKPGIYQSPAGMDALLNIKEQDLRDQANLAQLARTPANLNNWAQTKANYYATHPIMSPFDPSQPLGRSDVDRLNGGGGPAQPVGQTQADAPPMQGAMKALDGNWYVADPKTPGKFFMVR